MQPGEEEGREVAFEEGAQALTTPKGGPSVWDELELQAAICTDLGQMGNAAPMLRAVARGRALERVAIAAKECWGQSCDGFIAYTLEFQSALRDLDRMTVSSNEVKPKEIV